MASEEDEEGNGVEPDAESKTAETGSTPSGAQETARSMDETSDASSADAHDAPKIIAYSDTHGDVAEAGKPNGTAERETASGESADAPEIAGAPTLLSKRKKIAIIAAAVAVACALIAGFAAWSAGSAQNQASSDSVAQEQVDSDSPVNDGNDENTDADAQGADESADGAADDVDAQASDAPAEAAEESDPADDSSADASGDASAGSSGDSSAAASSDAGGSPSSSSSGASSSGSSSRPSSSYGGGQGSSGRSDGSNSGSGQTAPQTVSVSVTIDASNAHARNAAWPSNMYSGTVQVKAGASVYDALVATGASVGGNRTYVSSINGLAEKALSAGSGWMYKVNGVYPDYSCGKYKLSGGEDIVWIYTVEKGDVS